MTTKKILAVLMSAVLLASLSGKVLASGVSSNLRMQIAKTQQEYFALYNELNTNPQYKMVCRSVFGERTCRPLYVVEARQKARDVCSGFYQERPNELKRISEVQCGADRVQVLASAAAQEADFRKNVQQVFQRSPELQALGLKLEEMQGRQQPTKD